MIILEKSKKFGFLLTLIPLIYLVLTVILVITLLNSGTYPSGADTMYHIYRGEFVYQSLMDHQFFPLLDMMMYNGVELLRYGSLLPAYVMAFCQWLMGNSLDGYLLFVGLIFYFGALSWFYVGIRLKRPWLGALIGILWFFMPYHLYVLFEEGDLARSLCMTILPWFIYGISQYLSSYKINHLLFVLISLIMMILCHLMSAMMLIIATLIFFFIDFLFNRQHMRSLMDLIITIIIGVLISGIWIYPSLQGGMASMDVSEIMQSSFENLWILLNPLRNQGYYFGLAIFLLAVFGGFCSYKQSMPGFWLGIIIVLLMSTSMYPILKVLPGGQFLWMTRFISIALCFILYSFLMWDTLKIPYVLIICSLLIADMIPSMKLIYGNQSGQSVVDRFDELYETSLIQKAQEITNQRVAFIDNSHLDSLGAYLVSSYQNPIASTFGYQWHSATTTTNMTQLNRSMSIGNYLYLFDRCLELGNDSVIIQLSQLNKTTSIEELDNAALKVGYELVKANNQYRLYHIDTKGQFGTVNQYDYIGIGSTASLSSLGFPAIEETTSTNLNDYTYEELSKYKMILLSGFTYDDQEEAENLILQLSEAGVHIVIMADGIPESRLNHNQSFLDVTCHDISFSNGYPEMDTIDGMINADLFPQGHTKWNTVYLEGLDQTWGKIEDQGIELPFYGTVKNDHIVMVGLNLHYFYSLTLDPSIGQLLSHSMNISSEELPHRTIVPLDIQYQNNTITVTSSNDHVNTSLSYHDIFQSQKTLTVKNHMVIVDEGKTVITLQYPYLLQGSIMSGIGVISCMIYFVYMKKKLKKDEIKESS